MKNLLNRILTLALCLSTLALCLPSFASASATLLTTHAAATQITPKKPKLVLVLVYDQMRSDYLTRFESRFLAAKSKEGIGGFKFLMQTGAWYPLGEYDILQSMTGPGHATILSGSYPYQMGIPINDWIDAKGKKVYCVEDPAHKTVGALNTDPNIGTSPKNFIGSTLGDELKGAGYKSQVISIALKDRAAILMGGNRADLALWMDSSQKWVTSNYYKKELPEWVQTLKVGQDFVFKSEKNPTGLSSSNEEFSVTLKNGSKELNASPYGVQITVEAAEKAIDTLQLGKSGPDILAVSFSSHDYLGHAKGPNARELEEMTVAEDRLLARLLRKIDKKIGIDQTLIVLTADHGAPSSPEYLNSVGFSAAKRVSTKKISESLEQALKEKFGRSIEWVVGETDLNFYFNQTAIREKSISLAEFYSVAKKHLAQTPEVAQVFSALDFEARTLPPGMHERQILKTYYPGRSGEVIAIVKPYVLISSAPTTHFTGYSYDRYVPIILRGTAIKPGRYSQKSEVIDIAPTLAYLLGITPPATSEGRVLSEILKH